MSAIWGAVPKKKKKKRQSSSAQHRRKTKLERTKKTHLSSRVCQRSGTKEASESSSDENGFDIVGASSSDLEEGEGEVGDDLFFFFFERTWGRKEGEERKRVSSAQFDSARPHCQTPEDRALSLSSKAKIKIKNAAAEGSFTHENDSPSIHLTQRRPNERTRSEPKNVKRDSQDHDFFAVDVKSFGDLVDSSRVGGGGEGLVVVVRSIGRRGRRGRRS